jgi:heme-degrading monooxygenase HmoA
MIARIWRARTTAANQQAYVEHFTQKVLPELRAIDGFLGASLLKEERGGEVGFMVLTRWTSLGAIRGFAGEEISTAVVEPEAARVLTEYERSVQHWEIVKEAGGENGS